MSRQVVGPVATFLTAAATGVEVLLVHPAHPLLRLLLMLTAYGAFASMLVAQHVRPFLTRRLVFAALLPLLALSVVVPPHTSRDVWSYVMYGRTVAVHRSSPYRLAPDQVGPDPMLAQVDVRWRHQRAVYGPGFVAGAAVVAELAGTSPVAGRVAFQMLAALVALGCVIVVGRATGDPGAMAWLGLNPGLVLFVVNPGHNDLLVGAAVLFGVIAAARRHPAVAGAVVGLGALVKIIGLLVLIALAVGVARTAGRRAGAMAAAAGAVVVTTGYLLAGGVVAVLPLRGASKWHTPASLATAVHALAPHVDAIVVCQLVMAVVVGTLLVRGHSDPRFLVVGAVAVYLLAAPYVLPWYTAWVLPVAALAWRSRVAALLAAQSAAVAVISVDSRGVTSGDVHVVLYALIHTVLPVLEVVGLAVLVAVGCRRRSEDREPTATTALG